MKRAIDIPHAAKYIDNCLVEYRNLHAEVEGEPGTDRIVWLYVIDPECHGGELELRVAETKEAVLAIEGATLLDYWQMRFPAA